MVGDLTKLRESRRNRLDPRSVWRSGRVGLCCCCAKRPILAVLARRAWAVAGISGSLSSSSKAGIAPNFLMKGKVAAAAEGDLVGD
jgi:hypothetical protein